MPVRSREESLVPSALIVSALRFSKGKLSSYPLGSIYGVAAIVYTLQQLPLIVKAKPRLPLLPLFFFLTDADCS